MEPRGQDDIQAARADLIEALGQQSAFWGVGKLTGALYACLYLSAEPLTLSDLAQDLGTTKGNVSVSIRVLESLGMVRRSVRAGDRHVYFAAETDFWQIARTVLSRRHKPEFDRAFELVARSQARLRQAPQGPEERFALDRVDALRAFYDELDAIVGLVLLVDPRRLGRVLGVAARMRGRVAAREGRPRT
jgi:DNA-binding transcriptional regulator GbsR (MarR family)